MQKASQSFALQKIFGLKLSTKLNSFWGRRLVFFCILACFLLYYLVPYFYNYFIWSFAYGNVEQFCMKRHLAKFTPVVNDFDAVISHIPLKESEKFQIPFVGNGKVGSVADYEHPSLYLFYEKLEKSGSIISETTELMRMPFSLMIKPQFGYGTIPKDESVVLNYRHGIVEHLTCYSLPEHGSAVMFVNHSIVAHRSRPNVFLQHIEAKVERKSKGSFIDDINLSQDTPEGKNGFKAFPSTSDSKLRLYGGVMEVEKKYMSIVVAISDFPSSMRIVDGKAHTDSISVIMHGELTKDKVKSRTDASKLVQTVAKYAQDVLKVPIDVLLKEHKNAWSDILHTGLSISHSTTLEPGIPHPQDVNATLYSVLSSMDSKLHDKDIPQKERYDLMKRLQTPDFCYNGNPTLHAKRLWQHPKAVENVVELANLWSMTLKKSGCSHLVSEGAEGMLQAMVLSFGRLQFTQYFLQVHADADILHNDIAFRGVMYKNNTVDIVMRYEKGQSSIQISIRDSSRLPLYACEAGCSSSAVELTKQTISLPVFITYPASPILYISDSRKHLEDLKDTLIVKDKVEHAQHMESKKESGLPLIFWLSIGSLIVLFHLYLIRMICKEYYSSSSLPSHVPKTSYYSNHGRLAS